MVDGTIEDDSGKPDHAVPSDALGESPVQTTVGNRTGGTASLTADGRSAISEFCADLAVPTYGVMKLHDLLAQARIAALLAPANDNAIIDTDSVLHLETSISALSGGGALLAWVGPEEHLHARLFAPAELEAGERLDPPEYAPVNAAIGDLGPVAPTQEGARRLQVVEPRAGTFAIMWLALAESGLVMRGKVFVPAAQDNAGGTQWNEQAIDDVGLPGLTGGFRIDAMDGAGLLVAYETAGGSQSIVIPAVRLGEEMLHDSGHEEPAADALLVAAITLPAEDLVAEPEPETLMPHPPAEPRAGQSQSASPILGMSTAFNVAAEAGTNETSPIITALGDGFVVAWRTLDRSGELSEIRLALFDEHGVATVLADGSSVLLVSDRAAADTAPAISILGEGFAVAYKRADDGDLIVKTYDAAGSQIGNELVLDSGEAGAIGEIAAAAIQVQEMGGGNFDQLAVVYTVEDQADGVEPYGTIMLQRLAIAEEDGEAHTVTLGRDGDQEGDDLPAVLTMEARGLPAAVVGRAPVVTGLHNGEFAIIWVENEGTRETIRGGVLELHGAQVLHIDLTGLIDDEGIAKGTKPTLLDAGDGNILVSWLQHDDNDYVVMAAFYEAAGQGMWIEPGQAIRLKSFDEEPDDYSVALSDAGEPSIIVTWGEDDKGPERGDQILSQRYDMSGESDGRPIIVANRSSLEEQQNSTDSLAAAGLADGQIVVVYAEQGAQGDSDLAAHIVDISGSDQPNDPVDDAKYSTQIDQEIAINILGGDANVGLSIARVNGTPIDAATPVDVGSAWVQLREDGWLTVSPDAGYAGEITFEYTLARSIGSQTTNKVTVNVETAGTPAALQPFNQFTVLAEGVLPPHQDLGTEGLSIAGLNADAFTIIGSTFYLNAGVELDFAADKLSGTPEIYTASPAPFDADRATVGASPDAFVFLSSNRIEGDSDDELEFTPSSLATFRQLMNSGALAQVGEDVVVTLGVDDPSNPDTITLKGVSLSNLLDPDFRFS